MKSVAQTMKQNVISISESSTLEEAADLFVKGHIGTLPVVNGEGILVGILHIGGLLELIMPSFVGLVDDFDYVRGDFSIFENLLPSDEVAHQPVASIMVSPVSVRSGNGLLRTFALMTSHRLYDMPVVDDDGRLAGLASRVDIGTALLTDWCNAASEGAE